LQGLSIVVGVGAVALVAAVPAGAVPGIRPATGYVTDGPVLAMAQVGNTIYLGGSFTHIGARTGPLALLKRTNARLAATLPEVAGVVDAVVDDGNGGWFVGGKFNQVGTTTVRNLVHLRASGTLDAGFAPAPNGEVRALARIGGTLYVGGQFTRSTATTGIGSPR